MKKEYKIWVRFFIASLFLAQISIGCNSLISPEENTRIVLGNFTEKMNECYTDRDQSDFQKRHDELLYTISQQLNKDEILEEIYGNILRQWETECEKRTNIKSYSIYLLGVKGSQHSVRDKIIKILNDNDARVSCLEFDNIATVAENIGVSQDQLNQKKVCLIHHKYTYKIITDKILGLLNSIPTVSEVKMTVKDNPDIYSFGIYIPPV